MTSTVFDPLSLSDWQARIKLPPRKPRLPLLLNSQVVGSVEAGVLETLWPSGSAPSQEGFSVVSRSEAAGGAPSWHIAGDGTQAFAFLAQALHEANLGGVQQQWRNEALTVRNAQGQRVASAERGIFRLLGLATQAVHLNGRAPDGRLWLQQRALNKATDPGLWDTLMGGMVAAADNLTQALRRETWEEAGIALEQVQGLHAGGQFVVQRPNTVDGGVGYVVEHIVWFEGLIPPAVQPVNQDGEVIQFALQPIDSLRELLSNELLTTEAALILLDSRFGLNAKTA